MTSTLGRFIHKVLLQNRGDAVGDAARWITKDELLPAMGVHLNTQHVDACVRSAAPENVQAGWRKLYQAFIEEFTTPDPTADPRVLSQYNRPGYALSQYGGKKTAGEEAARMPALRRAARRRARRRMMNKRRQWTQVGSSRRNENQMSPHV
jgi:hypothetical protein